MLKNTRNIDPELKSRLVKLKDYMTVNHIDLKHPSTQDVNLFWSMLMSLDYDGRLRRYMGYGSAANPPEALMNSAYDRNVKAAPKVPEDNVIRNERTDKFIVGAMRDALVLKSYLLCRDVLNVRKTLDPEGFEQRNDDLIFRAIKEITENFLLEFTLGGSPDFLNDILPEPIENILFSHASDVVIPWNKLPRKFTDEEIESLLKMSDFQDGLMVLNGDRYYPTIHDCLCTYYYNVSLSDEQMKKIMPDVLALYHEMFNMQSDYRFVVGDRKEYLCSIIQPILKNCTALDDKVPSNRLVDHLLNYDLIHSNFSNDVANYFKRCSTEMAEIVKKHDAAMQKEIDERFGSPEDNASPEERVQAWMKAHGAHTEDSSVTSSSENRWADLDDLF